MRLVLDNKRFSKAIAAKRYEDRDGVRSAAIKAKTSTSTLSRCENGKIPDVITFANICNWLDIPMEMFFRESKISK